MFSDTMLTSLDDDFAPEEGLTGYHYTREIC